MNIIDHPVSVVRFKMWFAVRIQQVITTALDILSAGQDDDF